MGEDGDQLSKAGVVVTVTNVTPQLTQTTDAIGRYEFANLRNGTYNLTYTRPGLGLHKVFGFGHVGGEQPSFVGTTFLSQVSNTTVTNLTVVSPQFDSSNGSYAQLSATVANPTSSNSYRRVAVYASASAEVTSATGTLLGEYFVYQGSNGPTSTISVPQAAFTGAGFATGSRVYAIAYGAPDYYGNSYTEIATGRQVLTALNPVGSQVVSFTAP
ncbi:hypothetical protein [uncultured Hymenobacter sp.]|uniref:hypothetical protein n=1 Tax=uncultured Hymenobacter sp. TaxID=170016 RepID=UPI0035CA6015